MSPPALRPGTTVCVPTWNGAGFIGETLHALARQHCPGMRILISVDGNDAPTAAACAPFLADPRIRLIVQPQRLGWVGNTNALIAAVDTEFLAIMPHDDLPAPDWLARLHRLLRAHPDAACAYADLEGFGSYTERISQPEVLGPPLHRVLQTLLHLHACVAYRGLVRRSGPTDRPFIPTGLPEDIAADTAWLMVLAQRGALRREPRVLVRKRYHARATHAGWSRHLPQTRHAAAVALLARMRGIALATDGIAASQDMVDIAALLRLAGCGAILPPEGATDLPEMFAGFDAACGGIAAALVPPPWPSLARRPELEPLAALLAGAPCHEALARAEASLAGTPHAAAMARLHVLARHIATDRQRWAQRWSRAVRNVADTLRHRTGTA